MMRARFGIARLLAAARCSARAVALHRDRVAAPRLPARPEATCASTPARLRRASRGWPITRVRYVHYRRPRLAPSDRPRPPRPHRLGPRFSAVPPSGDAVATRCAPPSTFAFIAQSTPRARSSGPRASRSRRKSRAERPILHGAANQPTATAVAIMTSRAPMPGEVNLTDTDASPNRSSAAATALTSRWRPTSSPWR
jgi:hypothetical protein